LLLTFLVYPGVSKKIFQTFKCQPFEDGSSYLKADLSLSCDTDAYTGWLAYATAMVFVYPLGIPAFYFVVVFINRQAILDAEVLEDGEPAISEEALSKPPLNRIAFLLRGYEPKYWSVA
jgi:hypothetical protein